MCLTSFIFLITPNLWSLQVLAFLMMILQLPIVDVEVKKKQFEDEDVNVDASNDNKLGDDEEFGEVLE